MTWYYQSQKTPESVIYYLNTLNAIVSTAVLHSTLKVYHRLIKQIFPVFLKNAGFKKLVPLFYLFVPIFLWFAVSPTGGWGVPLKLPNPINLSGILSPLFSISYLYVAKNMLPGLSFFPWLVVVFFSSPHQKVETKEDLSRWPIRQRQWAAVRRNSGVVPWGGRGNAAPPSRPRASAWRQSHVTGARAAPPRR